MIDNAELHSMTAYFHAVDFFVKTTVEIKVDDEQLILKTHDTLDCGLLWNFSQFFGWKLILMEHFSGEFGKWVEYRFKEV